MKPYIEPCVFIWYSCESVEELSESLDPPASKVEITVSEEPDTKSNTQTECNSSDMIQDSSINTSGDDNLADATPVTTTS